MKLDLHTLVKRGLDWDDMLPDELRPIWVSHFKMMQEIDKIIFQRAVVPEDTINLDIETINAADASQKLACVVIYAKFLKKDGTQSCQLIFSRSKLMPDGLSQPRAKLFAAAMNAHTGEIVRGALQENHKEKMKLTDSQVLFPWQQLAAIQVENVLKHNLDVTYIQNSDENNIYMADKQQLYYSESINVYQQKIIPHEVTE